MLLELLLDPALLFPLKMIHQPRFHFRCHFYYLWGSSVLSTSTYRGPNILILQCKKQNRLSEGEMTGLRQLQAREQILQTQEENQSGRSDGMSA